MPWTTAKSRAPIESTSSRPMPGQPKTVSVSTAPPSRAPNCRLMTVRIGMKALRSACRMITVLGGAPLASAVRT